MLFYVQILEQDYDRIDSNWQLFWDPYLKLLTEVQ